MQDEGKVVQRMHLKRYLCTGLLSSMMLVSSSFGIQAKSTSTLHIELTGGLGTAEIITDEDITIQWMVEMILFPLIRGQS